METSTFIKRLIFTLTTGSMLCYLISFNSVGQTKAVDKRIKICRSELLKIRAGRPVALRYQDEVTADSLLQLTPTEQRMVSQYIKKSGHKLTFKGLENPFLMTTYRMESPTRKLLGYKIVVDTVHEDNDIMTFYLTKKQKILFWYLESAEPRKDWTCQT